MARPRAELQEVLEAIESNAYFQPPENVKLVYPCIVYARDDSKVSFADNVRYAHTKRYQVTVIDRDPDTELVDEVEALPMCTFDRWYAVDDLNHFVFHLYF